MNKNLLIGAGVLIAGIAGYLVLKKRKQNQGLNQPQNLSPVNQSTNGQSKQVQSYSPPAKSEFPLQIGSRGDNVKKLQAFLNQKINAGLNVDGVFGSKTAEAVKKTIGSSQVSESMFKQYIGAPVLSAGAGLSTGTQANSSFSLNPFTNFTNAAAQALSLLKPKS